MSRRRIQVVTSSSDEEEEHFEEEAPDEMEIPNITSVVISDEDFIDVSDNLSPPSPSPVPVSKTTSFVASDCPVNDCLRKMGLSLTREWLTSCILGLEFRVSGFVTFDSETKAKLCFGQFLLSDMNYIGAGVLPQNVHHMHMVDLPGPFVLQVDEIINISCPLKERYKNARQGIKRCLKLSMTDGVQRVFGMEYRPIPCKTFEELGPAGFKVGIRDVHVRHGLLMLVPEILEVLGGSVEELEMARRRLVDEINKPPRGKRSKAGVLPPLSTRATHAAWAQNANNIDPVPVHSSNPVAGNAMNSTFQAATPFHENVPGADTVRRDMQARSIDGVIAEFSSIRQTVEQSNSRESAQPCTDGDAAQHSTTEPTDFSRRESAELCSFSATAIRNEDAHMADRDAAQHSTSTEPVDFPRRESSELSSFSTTGIPNEDAHRGGRDAAQHSTRTEHADFPRRESAERSSFSATAIRNEDAHMVDIVEQPFILCEVKELPFTYLASLLAKWDIVQGNEPSIQGKIKCFLTGVKGFQYKQRSTFELRVYVDDGSLISEIMVHHSVVQKSIGYSPEEVGAALSSSDQKIVCDIKDRLKRFQSFLINFEGIIVLEMNGTSTVPVALEMNQGCPVSDAWLLLQRLKPENSTTQVCRSDQSDVINLSP